MIQLCILLGVSSQTLIFLSLFFHVYNFLSSLQDLLLTLVDPCCNLLGLRQNKFQSCSIQVKINNLFFQKSIQAFSFCQSFNPFVDNISFIFQSLYLSLQFILGSFDIGFHLRQGSIFLERFRSNCRGMITYNLHLCFINPSMLSLKVSSLHFQFLCFFKCCGNPSVLLSKNWGQELIKRLLGYVFPVLEKGLVAVKVPLLVFLFFFDGLHYKDNYTKLSHNLHFIIWLIKGSKKITSFFIMIILLVIILRETFAINIIEAIKIIWVFVGSILLILVHNIFMKKVANYQIQSIQRQRPIQKEENHVLPANKTSATFHNDAIYENSFSINKNQYPFINDPKKLVKSFKTIVNGSIIANKLQRIISISHPSIIQLQKIAKGSPRTLPGNGKQTYYYLYYEVVHYSLKIIALSTKKQSSIMPQMTSLDICQKLVGVIEYLCSEGIFYRLQLDDIGVTENGEIKIFISPLVIINSDDKQLDRKEMMTCVDKIMGWWGTTISNKQNTTHCKNSSSGLSNSFGFTTNQSANVTEQKINTSSFIDRRKQSFQEAQVAETTGTMRKSQNINRNMLTTEKIKKIDQQIKMIRQILNEKVKNRIRRQSGELLVGQLKQVSKIKHRNNPIFQSLKSKQSQLVGQSTNKQSIQQNINCINIYNNTHPRLNDQFANIQRKNIAMQSKPMYSYKIHPNNQAHQINIKPPHANYIDDDFYQQQEANISIDTYQMDIGGDFQPIVKISSNKKITTADRQRETSERNYKNKKQETAQRKQRKGSNQVANKSVTQSAGPMQFKNFVVKFIKPQFLAKKSNIYQDPDEYQSQKSKSVSRNMQVHYKQLTDAGKSATSHTHKSSSLGRQKMQNQQQKCFHYKSRSPEPLRNQRNCRNNMKKAHVIISNELAVPSPNRFIKNQKSEAVIGFRKIQDLEIGQKIIHALQKTKNAIELLNKVRLGRLKKAQDSKRYCR